MGTKHRAPVQRKVTKVWTTKDGTRVRICDMTDSHLCNTIRFLQRAHDRAVTDAFAFASLFDGESMASYYADQDADNAAQSTPDDVFPLYSDLLAEAERRGLKVAE